MINGAHDHRCPECGKMFECPVITHCTMDEEPERIPTLCPHCNESSGGSGGNE